MTGCLPTLEERLFTRASEYTIYLFLFFMNDENKRMKKRICAQLDEDVTPCVWDPIVKRAQNDQRLPLLGAPRLKEQIKMGRKKLAGPSTHAPTRARLQMRRLTGVKNYPIRVFFTYKITRVFHLSAKV